MHNLYMSSQSRQYTDEKHKQNFTKLYVNEAQL